MAYCVTATTKWKPEGVAVYFFETEAEALVKTSHLRGKGFRVKTADANGKPVILKSAVVPAVPTPGKSGASSRSGRT